MLISRGFRKGVNRVGLHNFLEQRRNGTAQKSFKNETGEFQVLWTMPILPANLVILVNFCLFLDCGVFTLVRSVFWGILLT